MTSKPLHPAPPLAATAPSNDPCPGLNWQTLDAWTLRGWPLPEPDHQGDKEDRGRVLLVAGSRELPGAALLAATAALRAGAGKITLVTGDSVATALALALPEARVLGLPETAGGGLVLPSAGSALLSECTARTDVVLIGPGLMDTAASCALVGYLLGKVRAESGRPAVPVILDALAMDVLLAPATGAERTGFAQPVLLTPHAGEMAHLTPRSKHEVQADALTAAHEAARAFNAVIALKGATTWIVAPDGHGWCHRGGNAGLAVSGSGDVLAGLMAGLCARGATLVQAAAWGVVLHAEAGRNLSARFGLLGSLARELPAEIPALMQRLHQPGFVTASPLNTAPPVS